MSCESPLPSPGEDISGKLFVILDGSSSDTGGKQDLNSGLGSLGEKSDLWSSAQGYSLLSSEPVLLRE